MNYNKFWNYLQFNDEKFMTLLWNLWNKKIIYEFIAGEQINCGIVI